MSLQAGDIFTVEVTYSGAPEQIESVALPVLTGWVTFDGGSYVVSEPDGAAYFYPVNDHPLDKATYSFRVTVPKPFEVAANGVLAETIDSIFGLDAINLEDLPRTEQIVAHEAAYQFLSP